MTAPDPASRPAPSDELPVTRAEFDRLIEVVLYMAHTLNGHRHGWSKTDDMTFGPADGAHKDFAQILKSLDDLEHTHAGD